MSDKLLSYLKTKLWYSLIIVLMFLSGGYSWWKPLRAKIESDKSAERFKNYAFLSDSLEGMYIDMSLTHQEGGELKIWNLLNHLIDTKSNVLDYQVEGNRVGILFSNGALWVKDLSVNDSLIVEHNVKDFQLEGDRIAVLIVDGNSDVLKVKEGPLDAGWYTVFQRPFIKAFQLENYSGGKRIGVLTRGKAENDTLFVMETPLAIPKWIAIHHADFIHSFQLDGERIAVLSVSLDTFRFTWNDGFIADPSLGYDRLGYKCWNRLLVKQGSLTAPFITVREHLRTDTTTSPYDTIIRGFQLKGNRIAILERISNPSGEQYDLLLAQESAVPGTEWEHIAQESSIKAFQLEGNRIGVLWKKGIGIDDSLIIKEGYLWAEWQRIYGSPLIKSFQMRGTRVAVLEEDKLLIAQDLSQPMGWDILPGEYGSFVLTDNLSIPILTLENVSTYVETNGASFALLPYSMEINQKIPITRQLGNLNFCLPMHWSLRKVTTGAAFLTGKTLTPFRQQDYWLRINSDGLIMLQSLLGEKMGFSVSCNTLKDTIMPNTPNLMLFDDAGGVSLMPIGWKLGETTQKYNNVWHFGLTPGQYFE